MKLKGAVTVNASQEEVWRIFMDPTQFCRVVPGCEKARTVRILRKFGYGNATPTERAPAAQSSVVMYSAMFSMSWSDSVCATLVMLPASLVRRLCLKSWSCFTTYS